MQGGTAAVAAPVMGPIADTAAATFGDTIVVEIGHIVANDVGAKVGRLIVQRRVALTYYEQCSSPTTSSRTKPRRQ